MVQETHFRPRGSFKFAAKHFPTAYVASDALWKAGVAILIKWSCSLHIKSSYLNPQGRLIFLDCDYLNQSLTLVNVYALNFGSIQFLKDLFERLENISQPFMIMGGDFYMTMSPNKDRSVLFTSTPSAKVNRPSFSWRIKHPTQRQFTFYSPPCKLYSRLHHFFISSPLLTSMVASEINLTIT